MTRSGVGSGAWFASVVWAAWIIWGGGFYFLGSEILDSGLLRLLEIRSSESFAPSRTGIGYWRLLLSVFGYRLFSDFIFPKTSFPGFAILSDVALRNMIYLANDIDEPRLRLARLLPRRRRDRRGRWLWRLVRPKFRG